MKTLDLIIAAGLFFVAAYFLAVVVAVSLPVVSIVVLCGALALLLAVVMWIFSVAKSLIRRFTGPKNTLQDNAPYEDDIFDASGSAINPLQNKIATIWPGIEQELAKTSLSIQKKIKRSKWLRIPKSFRKYIGNDSRSFNHISQVMDDEELSTIRIEYTASCQRINELEDALGDYRRSIEMKSETPGGPYHRLVEEAQIKLDLETSNKANKVYFTLKLMKVYGVELNYKQAEVLLSRVDNSEIMHMTAVFSVIAEITRKFAYAKRKSGENLGVTKKYYGMHIALLELQLRIQDDYLDKLTEDYIPGVQKIFDDTSSLRDETKRKIDVSDEPFRNVYENNLIAQSFTIKVTEVYRDALVEDTQKIKRARNLIHKHHDAAENTLKTVQSSADLSAMVRQNEILYNEVMELQLPELVPFENLQMQREFEALTERLRRNQS